MRYYEKIIACLTAVGNTSVSHVARMKSNRYIVWEEDGGNDLLADNKHGERSIYGIVDLFTKTEFDAWKREIEESFDEFGIAWQYQDMDYEEETGFYHYQWRWNCIDG